MARSLYLQPLKGEREALCHRPRGNLTSSELGEADEPEHTPGEQPKGGPESTAISLEKTQRIAAYLKSLDNESDFGVEMF